jgi:hypothetical protein
MVMTQKNPIMNDSKIIRKESKYTTRVIQLTTKKYYRRTWKKGTILKLENKLHNGSSETL